MTAVDARARRADIVVVTGLSGAGKSTAIKVFEDLGYYCVDNLPPVLLPKIVDVVSEARGEGARVALGMDIRGKEFLPDLSRVLDELRGGRSAVHVLFLDAADEALVRRFSETRRKHPLAARGGASARSGRSGGSSRRCGRWPTPSSTHPSSTSTNFGTPLCDGSAARGPAA